MKNQQKQESKQTSFSSSEVHNGQHGLGCKECEKLMMQLIGVDKKISKFSTVYVSNPYAPSKQIRDYLQVQVSYFGKEHGQRISQEKIEQLVDEYSEYLKAS